VRSRRSLALVAVVLTGCMARPELSPPPVAPAAVPSLAPTVIPGASLGPGPIDVIPASPTPPSTPEPSIPDDLRLTSTAEANGVRVTLRLARNPMPAGERTSLTLTITNTGDDPLQYYPCGEVMPVSASLTDPFRSGRLLAGPAVEWKRFLLGQFDSEAPGAPTILFLADGQDGSSSGCGDVLIVTSLAPGKTVRQNVSWDGQRFRGLGPPRTSPIDLVGTFRFDRGDVLAENPPEDRQVVEVHLDAWIDGPGPPVLDPAEAVDIALTDARLTDVLARRELRNGNEGLVRYVAAIHRYRVGIVESGSLPVAQVHMLEIDAETGAIVDWIERDWDYSVDGYP